MTQLNRIEKSATRVYVENGHTNVQFHHTIVVAFNESEIILNSGGWFTNTTKIRMNQTSNQFNLGFNVFQKDLSWFVEFNEKTIPFENGMILKRGC